MSDKRTAVARFQSCRWTIAEYCNHPDVRPFSGRTGFDAQAWCAECSHYKRKPRARPAAQTAVSRPSLKPEITLDYRGCSRPLDCLPFKARETYRLRLLEFGGDTLGTVPSAERKPMADARDPDQATISPE